MIFNTLFSWCLICFLLFTSSAFSQKNKSTIDGLSAEVKYFYRQTDWGSYKYSLTWKEKKYVWVLDSVEVVYFRYWDNNKKLIKSTKLLALIGDDFADYKTAKIEIDFLCPIPQKAEYLSVELGTSGLETKKVKIVRK